MIERPRPLLMIVEFDESTDFAVRCEEDYVQLMNILGSIALELAQTRPQNFPIFVTYPIPKNDEGINYG